MQFAAPTPRHSCRGRRPKAGIQSGGEAAMQFAAPHPAPRHSRRGQRPKAGIQSGGEAAMQFAAPTQPPTPSFSPRPKAEGGNPEWRRSRHAVRRPPPPPHPRHSRRGQRPKAGIQSGGEAAMQFAAPHPAPHPELGIPFTLVPARNKFIGPVNTRFPVRRHAG